MQTTTRKLAVITGGSSGIGLALAQQFAANGFDLLLAAEDGPELAIAARTLGASGARVETVTADLATPAGVDTLVDAVRERGPVDALCVNAGVGLGGRFTETDLDRELAMIDLNVRGAVQLTKPIVRDMAARGRGRILFTSSIAATMPGTFEAVYAATKVFLRSFSGALREELKDTGVTVTALMPSTTETAFFRRADMMDTRAGTMKKDSAETVAKAGYEALMAGRAEVVPTIKNKIMAAVADLTPTPLAARSHRMLSEPGSAKRKPAGGGMAPLALGAAALGVGALIFARSRRKQRPEVTFEGEPIAVWPTAEPTRTETVTASSEASADRGRGFADQTEPAAYEPAA